MAQPDLTLSGTAPPARLGRFVLGHVLGQGATGIVYAATDTQNGRLVALKTLSFPQNLSPSRRHDLAERFAREARAVSQLSHPGIIALSEFGRAEDGRSYLVMERLTGETLRTRLQRAGPLLTAEAMPLLTQIADALQYAHGRGIIHRDVKPDNIFLCADGTAKLMDFGVARVYADEGLTQAGTVIGSPAYMSPEQVSGMTLDGRSDVFSLAICAAEALTGHRPFEGPDIASVMYQIVHKPPQLGGVGARPLRRILEQALAKAPASRTPSAGAFASALRQAAPQAAFALSETEAASLTTLVMVRSALSPTRPDRSVQWALAGLGILALIGLSALPLALHHPGPRDTPMAVATLPRDAVSRTAIVTSPVTTERARPPQHLTALDNGEGWIVETTPRPHPKAMRPQTALWQALRNETIAPDPVPPFVPKARRMAPTFASVPAETISQASSTSRVSQALTIPPDAVLYGMDNRDTTGPTEAPHLIRHTDPIYPPAATNATGTARLLVSVNPDGDVSDARVVQSSGDSGLDAAAIATVLHWEYAPATHDGHPVPANIAETVTFGPH